jgi:hypothetical protein
VNIGKDGPSDVPEIALGAQTQGQILYLINLRVPGECSLLLVQPASMNPARENARLVLSEYPGAAAVQVNTSCFVEKLFAAQIGL